MLEKKRRLPTPLRTFAVAGHAAALDPVECLQHAVLDGLAHHAAPHGVPVAAPQFTWIPRFTPVRHGTYLFFRVFLIPVRPEDSYALLGITQYREAHHVNCT